MRRERENRLALRLAVGTVVAVVAVVAGFWFALGNRVAVQTTDFCPVAEATPRTTVVLIDDRANLQKRPAEVLREKIESRSLDIVRRERVVLLALDKDGVAGVPLFDRCSPGTMEEANPAIENPKRMARRYAEDFIAPMLASALSVRHSAGDDAPLIEALSGIGKRVDAVFHGQAGARRLVLISPFLQSSPGLRQAQDCESSFPAYLRSEFAHRYPVDLKGMVVMAHLIAFEGPERSNQRRSARQFWEQLLGTSLAGDGEVPQSIKPLPVCYYPTLEDEARRFIKLTGVALGGCRIGEAVGHLKTATAYSAEVTAGSGLSASIARRRVVCEELARAREEERQRKARAEAAPTAPR